MYSHEALLKPSSDSGEMRVFCLRGGKEALKRVLYSEDLELQHSSLPELLLGRAYTELVHQKGWCVGTTVSSTCCLYTLGYPQQYIIPHIHIRTKDLHISLLKPSHV